MATREMVKFKGILTPAEQTNLSDIVGVGELTRCSVMPRDCDRWARRSHAATGPRPICEEAE